MCSAVSCCCFRNEGVSSRSSLQASNLRRPCRHDITPFLVNRALRVQLTAVSVPVVLQAVCLVVPVICPAGGMFRRVCRRRRMVVICWTLWMMRWMWTACHQVQLHRWRQRQPLTANSTWMMTRMFLIQRCRLAHLALCQVSFSYCSY